ncbi:MAG: hypothetical protein HYX80_06570 [Chloroflexi bacterium]|nr:hypothetical protein [Chloroflexota bacterium]
MEKTLKAVLFDIHGTLFDQELAQRRILECIVRKFPKVFDSLTIRQISEAFAQSHRLTAGDSRKDWLPIASGESVPAYSSSF